MRDELGLVPKPPSAPGAAGQVAPVATSAPPAAAGARSHVFSDGAKFQASRQISGDGQRKKTMLLPAGIQSGSGPCPKCRGYHPEARECPNTAAERDEHYVMNGIKRRNKPAVTTIALDRITARVWGMRHAIINRF